MPPHALKRPISFSTVSALKCGATLKGGSILRRTSVDPLRMTESGGSIDSIFSLKTSRTKSGRRLKASPKFTPLVTVIHPVTDTVQISELGSEIFIDDFNRSDGALGGSWEVGHGSGSDDWKVIDNTAGVTTTATAWATHPSGRPTGVSVSAIALDDTGARTYGLVLNLEPNGDSPRWQAAMFTFTPNMVAVYDSNNDIYDIVAFTAGDRFTLTDDGVTITAYVNGAPVAYMNHNPVFESGDHGVFIYSSGAVESFTDHSDEPYTDHADDPYLPH